MRRLVRFVLLALVLMVVTMVSALTAMRFAIHGREVAVPSFQGMTRKQAEAAAEELGLVLTAERRFYSATVPEGRIVSQVPPPGNKLRRGSRVRIAESRGLQRARIPNVVGQSARAAELNLRRRGLELGAIAMARLPGVTGNQVIAQSPPADAAGVTSPRVSVLVGLPEEPEAFLMPNFAGRSLADATALIAQAGFKLGKVTDAPAAPAPAEAVPAPRRPGPQVVGQSPAAGQKVTREVTIALDVRR